MTTKRPFFSLVVPCYNDGRYARGAYLDRLLTSVCNQGIRKTEIEVILVDDCSPVSFSDIVDKYKTKLNIQVISLDQNLRQSNAREQGALVATGEWLCFSDHDDKFYPKALKRVKETIQDREEKYIVYSAFNRVSIENENDVVEHFVDPNLDNWIHGKFYNVDNFWKRCNLHFITDLMTHEDIALGNAVKCALHSLQLSERYHTYISEPVYMWTNNPSSISSTQYVTQQIDGIDHVFHEMSFADYIRANSEPYFIAVRQGQLTSGEGTVLCLASLLQCWLSLNSFILKNKDNYLKINDAFCSKLLYDIQQEFNLVLPQVKVIVSTMLPDMQKQIDELSKSSPLPSLHTWLDYLHGIDFEKSIAEWNNTNNSSLVYADGKSEAETSCDTLNRPFFSIVVPCYNDGRYCPDNYLDRLLNNLQMQGLKKEDLEVILVDDCSLVPYSETIKKYEDKLNLVSVPLMLNKGQSNAREQGAQLAKGRWLCFCDHDDLFYPDALDIVREAILYNQEGLLVSSAFNKVDSNDLNVVIEEFRDGDLDTWIHGKFYNMDNLWKKCDIHFLVNMRTHEDIALGMLIKCALHSLGLPQTHGLYVDTPCYIWVNNPDSISNSVYVPKKINGVTYSYHELAFNEYIQATMEPFTIAYNKGWLNKNEVIIMKLTELLKYWISLDSFRKDNPDHYLEVNDAYCSKQLHILEDEFNLSIAQIKVLVATWLKDYMDKVNALAVQSSLPDIHTWLDDLNKMNYQAVINKWDAFMLSEETATPTPEVIVDSGVRPFFSLVIACYNDGRYAEGVYLDRLLASVTRQGLTYSDIEVILSDDCSPVPYDEIVTKYESKFKIKRTKTDYNCCPGNTRAKGVELVEGTWLCFADHDDIFYDGALIKVKEGIIAKGEIHYAFGDFYGVDPEGKVTRSFEMTMNWCHAKFYNIDNFWKPMGIHFIKDLKSHEDIAICTQVGCALEILKRTDYTYFHFPVYAWTDNPQSVSHAKYTVDTETGPREFLEVFFEDYIHATGYIYLDLFKEHKISIVYAVNRVLEVMLYCYFYTQAFMFKRPDDYYVKNLAYAGEYVRKCKTLFNMTNDSMHRAIASNGAIMYLDIRKQADPGCGYYMPLQTLRYWFEVVCESYLDS